MHKQMNAVVVGRELNIAEIEEVSGGILLAVVGAAVAVGTLAVALFHEGCELGAQMAARDNAR